MLANLYWLGLKTGSGWGWTPTAREGWAVTILCLVMLLMASLVVSRLMRFLIAAGVIAALMSIGLASGAVPG
jgi:hypothetical protein